MTTTAVQSTYLSKVRLPICKSYAKKKGRPALLMMKVEKRRTLDQIASQCAVVCLAIHWCVDRVHNFLYIVENPSGHSVVWIVHGRSCDEVLNPNPGLDALKALSFRIRCAKD